LNAKNDDDEKVDGKERGGRKRRAPPNEPSFSSIQYAYESIANRREEMGWTRAMATLIKEDEKTKFGKEWTWVSKSR